MKLQKLFTTIKFKSFTFVPQMRNYRQLNTRRAMLMAARQIEQLAPAAVKPRLHQIQVSQTSNLYPDISGYKWIHVAVTPR